MYQSDDLQNAFPSCGGAGGAGAGAGAGASGAGGAQPSLFASARKAAAWLSPTVALGGGQG